MEGNLTLDNSYFNPIYALAENLDLTICIHTGSGSRHLMQLFDVARNHTFAHNRVLPVVAFRDLVANRIPEQFPRLRFGFIEAAASWVPYIWHVLKRSVRGDLKHTNPQELFRDYRFWIACEADEELPHLLNYIGEDHIVIGSDYGHNDPSKEPEFVKNMRAREDVAPTVVEKILSDNARALYGLS
jgi:predicted TIM-barrel fold metal-dependent hydrolase